MDVELCIHSNLKLARFLARLLVDAYAYTDDLWGTLGAKQDIYHRISNNLCTYKFVHPPFLEKKITPQVERRKKEKNER